MKTVTIFAREVIGPRGGIKHVHGVECDGEVLLDDSNRRKTETFFFKEVKRLRSLGYPVTIKTRNWNDRK